MVRRVFIVLSAALAAWLLISLFRPTGFDKQNPDVRPTVEYPSPPSADQHSVPVRGVDPSAMATPVLPLAASRDPTQARVAERLPGGIRLLPEAKELTKELNQPDQPPEHDLEVMENLLATYRGIFGQNPPGGLNSEITAALIGANAKQLAVMPPDQAFLNAKGELVDRWGTPFYFHPVSSSVMEVLSAGPDQKLWTPDDVGKLNPAGAETRADF